VTTYAYFGPAGTFTEQALRTLPQAGAPDVAFRPLETVPMVLDAVRSGECDFGLVPIENSIEGAVTVTMDELAVGEPLTIVAEAQIRVSFALLVRDGTALTDVRTVATHGHAAAQCRRWIASHLSDAHVHTAISTAGAAAGVADGSYDAAIAAHIAADTYGLVLAAEGIEDRPGAATRFVLVSRPVPPPEPSGTDKSRVVAFIRDNHPGALMEVLTEFSVRGIDLTRLESRPTGSGMGRYSFSIDLEGHIAEARVAEALVGLRRVCADVRFLGSYPRADKELPKVRPGTTDADFAEAHAWLEALKVAGTVPGGTQALQ
jgi:prephenate dehydratase